MKPERVIELLSGLRILPYFPSDEFAILSLVKMLGSMVENEQQVSWLVDRMTSGIYDRWPGPAEMRAVFCSRYKPKDGITTYSTVHAKWPDDPAFTKKQVAGPEMKQIDYDPQSKKVSEDPAAQRAIEIAVAVKQLKDVDIRRKATPEEIANAPAWLRKLEGYE